MQIKNQQEEIIAYLERNIIVHAGKGTIIGLVLDTCVYNVNGKWAGKFFDQVFRNKDGYVIGKLDKQASVPKKYNVNEILIKSWDIVEKIENYNCARVPALTVWDKNDMVYFLQ